MYQKDLVRQLWANAGLYASKDATLRAFLRHFDETSTDCWPELVEECRLRYSKYMQILADPLWASGDKLVRLNLLRFGDPARSDELRILSRFVGSCEPSKDLLELRAALHTRHRRIVREVARKKNLPEALREQLKSAQEASK